MNSDTFNKTAPMAPSIGEVQDLPLEFIPLQNAQPNLINPIAKPTEMKSFVPSIDTASVMSSIGQGVKNLQTVATSTASSWFNTTNILIIIGLVITAVLGYLYYDVYSSCTFDSVYQTAHQYVETCRNWILGDAKTMVAQPEYQNVPSVDEDTNLDGHDTANAAPTCSNEVYNVDQNIYTYKEAPLVCEALGGKLATYNQVREAHKKGAHWCNYGWSQDQMALYPIQEKKWKDQQKCGEKPCGEPGVNGGFFNDASLQFGVNCYGPKPKPDEGRVVYTDDTGDSLQELREKIQRDVGEGNVLVRPFNKNYWSKYSFKKSKYIIDTNDDIEDIIEETVSEHEKDPYTLREDVN